MSTGLSRAASGDHSPSEGPTGAEPCYSKLPEKNTNRKCGPFVGRNNTLPSFRFFLVDRVVQRM